MKLQLFFVIVVSTTLPGPLMALSSAWFPPFSKLDGLFAGEIAGKGIRPTRDPGVSLLVEIPMSTVHYKKPLDVRAGGRFFLETPMERYAYSSAGRSNLKRVQIVYLMQSMYRPNNMCFFLHFWSRKDPAVPWDTPRIGTIGITPSLEYL